MKILTFIMVGLLAVQAVIYFSDRNKELDTNSVDNEGEVDENDLV